MIMGAALSALSFMGLCGAARDLTGLDGPFLPLAVACGGVAALTLAGALDGLLWGWRLLRYGGLFAFGWRLARQKGRIGWLWALLPLAAAVYGLWHYRDAFYLGPEAVAHWGLVPRVLLAFDRLHVPMDLLASPSRPVGAGLFIWWLCRGFRMDEAAVLSAQLALYVIALMPLAGLLRRDRPAGGLAAGLAALFMVTTCGRLAHMLPDALAACVCAGGMAAVARYRDDPRKASAVLWPVCAALPLIHGAGLLLAILLALSCAWVSIATGTEPRQARRVALIGAGLSLLALAVWQAQVSLAYGGTPWGRLAALARSWRAGVRGASMASMKLLALGLLRQFIVPRQRLASLAAVLVIMMATGVASRRDDTWHPRWRRSAVLTALILIVGGLADFAWLLGRPVSEWADQAAYQAGLILILAMGVQAVFLLEWLGRPREARKGWRRLAMPAAALGCALAFAVLADGPTLAKRIIKREAVAEGYLDLLTLRDEGVTGGGSYLVFCRDDQRPARESLEFAKYEYLTDDILLVTGGVDREGYDYGAWYVTDVRAGMAPQRVDDLEKFIRDNVEGYDWLLVYDDCPELYDALDAAMAGRPERAKLRYAAGGSWRTY